ncbi:MAG: hypothetical protein CEN87_87 [Parcubacteria group bacterium Licking1014_1]|nr:MAG: hypothetical protein CEN87_87 [Parcubacteria group bacterium Licking1014_1]
MKKLLSQIAAATAGLWLASSFVPGVLVRLYPESNLFGVALTSQWQIFLVLGIILGLINFFRGIFSLIISITMIWFLDIMFEEIYIPLWWPLLWTTLIIFSLNLAIQKFLTEKK